MGKYGYEYIKCFPKNKTLGLLLLLLSAKTKCRGIPIHWIWNVENEKWLYKLKHELHVIQYVWIHSQFQFFGFFFFVSERTKKKYNILLYFYTLSVLLLYDNSHISLIVYTDVWCRHLNRFNINIVNAQYRLITITFNYVAVNIILNIFNVILLWFF